MALLDFLQQGAQGVQSALAPQSGFRDKLRDVSLGLAMGSNANDAISKAGLMLAQGNERRQGQKAKNRTMQWLQEQGVGEQEAQIIASDPKAFSAWYGEYRNAGKPDWKVTEIYDEQGRPAKAMVDMNTGRFNIIGGSKSDTLSPEAEAQKVRIAGAGATQVNVGDGAPGLGKLSSDYGYVLDPATGRPVIDPETGLPQAAPIPGSPAAQEAAGATQAAESKEEQQQTWNAIVDQEIGRALNLIDSANLPTTGLGGDVLSGVGGTAARDLRALLDTIKANAGFDRLQAMRDSSPTGGALGQVSERELAFLQSTIGNLEQSQSEEQLRFNLQRLQRLYQNMLSGKRAYDGLLDDDSQGGGLPEGVTEEDLRYTMEKHGLSREEVLERLNAR